MLSLKTARNSRVAVVSSVYISSQAGHISAIGVGEGVLIFPRGNASRGELIRHSVPRGVNEGALPLVIQGVSKDVSQARRYKGDTYLVPQGDWECYAESYCTFSLSSCLHTS